jgi:hypothetical protein
MLKIASSGLGMAPAQAMRIAESLYTSGYLSYPRTGELCVVRLIFRLNLSGKHTSWYCQGGSWNLHSGCAEPCFVAELAEQAQQVMGHMSCAESSAYPPGYDFQEVLVEMRRHQIWGEYAQHLMTNFLPPRVST